MITYKLFFRNWTKLLPLHSRTCGAKNLKMTIETNNRTLEEPINIICDDLCQEKSEIIINLIYICLRGIKIFNEQSYRNSEVWTSPFFLFFHWKRYNIFKEYVWKISILLRWLNARKLQWKIIWPNFCQENMDFWIEGIAVSFISTFGIFGKIFSFFWNVMKFKYILLEGNQNFRIGHSNYQLPLKEITHLQM